MRRHFSTPYESAFDFQIKRSTSTTYRDGESELAFAGSPVPRKTPVESFDQSLKYLVQHEPADFLRFGSGDPAIQVLGPIPSDLPSRGRDVDGGYLILRGGKRVVAHLEFHRRHQSARELAIDVAEAQIRLFRRELLPVLSQVWDLYGKPDEPFLGKRMLTYGAGPAKGASRSTYQRVNLRALGAGELLSNAPPGLWPLIALTRDGASQQGVRRAHDAIEARTDLSPARRADHLAVLWFVAEAEQVPVEAMKVYITKEKLMESSLYKSIFEEGKALGEASGQARGETRGRVAALARMLDPTVRERIRTCSDADTLEAWCEEATLVADAEAARRLAEKIQKAPLA
jgi:hypothetical protein